MFVLATSKYVVVQVADGSSPRVCVIETEFRGERAARYS